MSSSGALTVFIVAILSLSCASQYEDGAYLDPPYPKVHAPITLNHIGVTAALPAKSNVAYLITKQTDVKSQEARGTCSIFSAVAMVESLLIISKEADPLIDYSEEYLQFLISPGKTDSGSSSYSNIPAMGKNGLPTQNEYPYIGEEWKYVDQSKLSQIRCGKVPASYQPSCLVGHRDTRLISQTDAQLRDPTSPFYDLEFLAARTSATMMREKYLFNVSNSVFISTSTELLQFLNAGIPVLLDIDFYYGAWNHRIASNYGIPRNMTQWYSGIVTYPEPNSMDRVAYEEEPAGHSVLIVGYDNDIVVTNTELLSDGTKKECTYQGVYIFKNSWGTDSFGIEFEYDNEIYPGYGMITQKYANEFGRFFKMLI